MDLLLHRAISVPAPCQALGWVNLTREWRENGGKSLGRRYIHLVAVMSGLVTRPSWLQLRRVRLGESLRGCGLHMLLSLSKVGVWALLALLLLNALLIC